MEEAPLIQAQEKANQVRIAEPVETPFPTGSGSRGLYTPSSRIFRFPLSFSSGASRDGVDSPKF
ncbi:hypothetical protein AKJ38_00495 [candidate division MSBL1 archaeon SCGC-AAA259I14]|uniref:Uncharacterized protein n=1 Tax=candidate division MSBL1 archaeon SCGC-AAA259I14 TaxID=1698268 RepID=A0A133UU52_9EURY|nr:hypothetical protein AKJ38_00495 [candidate division MSBL1 archaeon SCGC-AAA259I14]